MIVRTAAARRELLDRIRTVAIVGASADPARPSYFVLRYLATHGYDVWPVTPAYPCIDGWACYPSLTALVAEQGRPDIVDVFRRPDALPGLVEEVIALGIRNLWLQYGVVHEAAIRRADEAGLTLVVDRCMKVEHARFAGGLRSQGFNTGLVTARRRASASMR